MKPTPPVTTTRATVPDHPVRLSDRRLGGGGGRHADALVAQAGADDVRETPYVPPVDQHGRRTAVSIEQPPPDLCKVRCAVAAPLRQKDERMRAFEGLVVPVDDLHTPGVRRHRRGEVSPR